MPCHAIPYHAIELWTHLSNGAEGEQQVVLRIVCVHALLEIHSALQLPLGSGVVVQSRLTQYEPTELVGVGFVVLHEQLALHKCENKTQNDRAKERKEEKRTKLQLHTIMHACLHDKPSSTKINIFIMPASWHPIAHSLYTSSTPPLHLLYTPSTCMISQCMHVTSHKINQAQERNMHTWRR